MAANSLLVKENSIGIWISQWKELIWCSVAMESIHHHTYLGIELKGRNLTTITTNKINVARLLGLTTTQFLSIWASKGMALQCKLYELYYMLW